jgi:hypothetical protein
MRFLIRSVGGPLPDIPLGPPGLELGCYLPAGIEWRQLNYGQGEGQFEVAGLEWGIYQTDGGGLALVLHFGELAAEDGMAFARRVAEAVTGGTRFELLLRGTEAEPGPAPDTGRR